MKRILLVVMVLVSMQLMSQEKETQVIIHTPYGDITVKLYNDTPIHRDNFIELVESGWYNGSNFHRIIKNFMIQGGSSKSGAPDPGYTLPAEFRPNHIHKRGALSAARQPDQVNPEKASSGSQFYIVQGKIFNDAQISGMSAQSGFMYSEAERNIYKTEGGSPWLDGEYTVFGEVVSGIEVVDQIAVVPVGAGHKPGTPIEMTMEIVK